MWLYCPNCNNQKDIGKTSRYNVFVCDHCTHRFRGIHASPNKLWGTATAVFWSLLPLKTHYEDFESTKCPYCQVAITPRGKWPSVCSECTRDLPTSPATNPIPVVSQQVSTPSPVPSPATAVSPPNDFDGCGPCKTCGYVFQMKFINAVCPRCENKMTREDAFFSCGSYPDSMPPENQ